MLSPARVPGARQNFRNFGRQNYWNSQGHKQTVFYLWRPLLNDPGDDMVAEVAVAAACDAIVAHNIKDFARAKDLGVAVFTPAEFLVFLQAR